MASGIKGINKLRKVLRRIEPELQEPIKQAIQNTAEAIKQDAILLAPIDEGDLVRSIQYKLGRDGFTAVVGPGVKAAEIAKSRDRAYLRSTATYAMDFGTTASAFSTRIASGEIKLSAANKHDLFQFFKGYWIEFGTKGSAAYDGRRDSKRSKRKIKYNIPPQPARPFMGPAWLLNREYGLRQVREAVKIGLDRASRGVTDG